MRNAGMLLFLLCPSDKTVCKHSTISAIISHAAITCFVSLVGEKEIQFYECAQKPNNFKIQKHKKFLKRTKPQ